MFTGNLWTHSFLMRDTLRAYFSDNFVNNNKKTVIMKRYFYLIGLTVYRELLEILAEYGVNPKLKAQLDQRDLYQNHLVEFFNKSGNVTETTKNSVISHVYLRLTTEDGKVVREKFSVRNFKPGFRLSHKITSRKYSVLELLMNILLNNMTVMKTQHSLKSDDMNGHYPMAATWKIDENDATKAAPAGRNGTSNERETYTSSLNVRPELRLRETLEICFRKKKNSNEKTRVPAEEKRKLVHRLRESTKVYTVEEAERDLVPKKSGRGRPSTKRKAEEQENDANDAEKKENQPGKGTKRSSKKAKSSGTMDDDNENSDAKSAAEVTLKSSSASSKGATSKKGDLEEVIIEVLKMNNIGKSKIAKIASEILAKANGDERESMMIDSDDEHSDEEDDGVGDDDKADDQDESVYSMIQMELAEVGLQLADYYDTDLKFSAEDYQQKLCEAIMGVRRTNKTKKTYRQLEMLPLLDTSIKAEEGHLRKLLDDAKEAKYNAKVKMYTFKIKKDEPILNATTVTIGDEAATNEIPILRDGTTEEGGFTEYFLLKKMSTNKGK